MREQPETWTEPPENPGSTPAGSPPGATVADTTRVGPFPRTGELPPVRVSLSGPPLPANAEESDRYEIRGEIGRGGMGTILQSHDRVLGRDLAVKVLLEKHQDRPDVVRRFVEEARIGGQLQHPGIVPVYELGEFADRRPYFTMKLVQGRTLAELLDQRAGPDQDLPRFLKIFEQVCQTMAYAHARGVIHRDLKPQNVMVGAFGEVQVMDWGLAKLLARDEKDSSPQPPPRSPEGEQDKKSPGVVSVSPGDALQAPPLGFGEGAAAEQAVASEHTPAERTPPAGRGSSPGTHAGSILGTPAYMAPEQARGEAVDERSDVFGLGAILCEILTGKPPYSGASRADTQRRAAGADLGNAFARLDACGADEQLLLLAKSCLSAEPGNRPRDAGAAAEAVTAHLASVQERLRTAELTRAAAEARAEEERRRRRMTLALGSAILALAALGVGGGLWVQRREEARRALEANRVTQALAEANRLWGRARGSGDAAKWAEARAAVRATRELPGAASSEELLRQVQELETNVENEVREEQRDRRMVASLEEIRTRRAEVRREGFDFAGAAPAYALAFRDYGIDVEKLPPEVAGARLRERPILLDLAAALDEWAWIRRLGGAAAEWRRIAAAAREADPDPWRNRFRDALAKDDPQALEAVARTAPVEKLPARTLEMLGHALGRSVGAAEAVEALSRARRRFPGDFWINHYLAFFLASMAPPRYEEAVRYYSAAIALRGDNPGVYVNLASALEHKGERDEAIRAFEKALELKPDYAGARFGLGVALLRKKEPTRARVHLAEAVRLQPGRQRAHFQLGRALLGSREWDDAAKSFREALRLKPDDATAKVGLGAALMGKGALKEAVAELKKARAAHPDNAEVYAALGSALANHNKVDEALPAFREAIRLQPGFAEAYKNMGIALTKKKLHDQAAAALGEAVRLAPEDPRYHFHLGLALRDKGDWRQAVACFGQSLCLNPDDAEVYHNLGILSSDRKDDPEGARWAFTQAIRLKPDYAEAYGNLGHVLKKLGRFREALAATRRCHELGSAKPGWRYPSARWVEEANRLLELDARLTSVLLGKSKAGPIARLNLARFCATCRRYATSARLCREAFAARPALAEDLGANNLYNAACMAARAGLGQGADAEQTSDADRRRWRRQALDWLTADLASWEKELKRNPARVRFALPHWQRETALAAYRDEESLAELPEDEREAWKKLWVQVAALLKHAAAR
jgi:serine/threonine-protein kinase